MGTRDRESSYAPIEIDYLKVIPACGAIVVLTGLLALNMYASYDNKKLANQIKHKTEQLSAKQDSLCNKLSDSQTPDISRLLNESQALIKTIDSLEKQYFPK